MLPSDYISVSGLYNDISRAYIDTGIAPTPNMSFEISFGCDSSSAVGYVFGSRDSNSNTAQKQINFYLGQANGSSYFGYNATRISKTTKAYESYSTRYHISSKLNDCTFVNANRYVYEFVGTAGTWASADKNIYLFGLNNGGSYTSNVGGDLLTIYGFRLYDGETLVRDMFPVYKISTSEYGMYDYANDVFYGKADSNAFPTNYRVLVETDQTDGGEAFIKVDGAGYVKKHYACYGNTRHHLNTPITVSAQARDGYSFDHWEINNTYVSNELEYTFQPTADTVIKAIFLPEITYQKNPYRATIMKYNISTGSASNSYRSASYVTVLRGDINEDLLQRSTSTIECLSVPDSVQINTPIFLYDPKGRILYYGVVKAIDGNKLTCREPISLYDDDYLLTTSKYQADYTTLYGVYQNLQTPGNDNGFGFTTDKRNDLLPLWIGNDMPIETSSVPTKVMPLIDKNSVVNMEDKLLNAYSELDVLIKYGFNAYSSTKFFMSATPTMNRYEKLTIGDDHEAVTNVSVNVQEADATAVCVYNSGGTTFRGNAYMKNNGVIDIYESGASYSGIDMTQYVGYSLIKQKFVTSDDNLKTVALENLNGALYSHKITFTLNKNNLLRFDDIHLGQYVDFYYKNKLYKSVITAWSYSFSSDNQIQSMNITMGNVRTTLTAILNKKNKR